MMVRRKVLTKRILIFLFALVGIYCFMFFSNFNSKQFTNFNYGVQINAKNDAHSCAIPKLDVHAPEIMQHIKQMKPLNCKDDLLNLIYTQDGYAKLKSDVIEKYKDAHCSIVYIIRINDNSIKLSDPVELNLLKQEIKMEHDYFEANCKIPSIGKSSTRIYASVSRNEQLVNKLKAEMNKNVFNLNVMFYGFDSLSRVHFQRKLPKTYDLLTKKLNATVLQSYNIVGDGSPQALIPILTAQTEIELPTTLKNKPNSNYVDVYPFIWRNFSQNGYVTQYGEDTPDIGTFTYRMKGFNKQPTDLYLRPYYLRAWKKHFRRSGYCYAGSPRHEIMLNWTTEFFSTYKDVPKYSFNFYTEISHDDFNLVQIADDDIVNWFNQLDKANTFDNTIAILMSDHGARFNEMRSTLQGKYEERLPFFSFILPKWFPDRFPNAYQHLKENAKTRLLTPFDIYSTLMTILTHFNKGKDVDKFVDYSNRKLPRSLSIFEYIPLNRSCRDAYIDNHWCTCLQWTNLGENDEKVIEAGEKLVQFINEMNSNQTDECNQLTVKQITRAQKIEPEKDLLNFKKSADANGFVPDLSDRTKVENELYQIQLIANPSDAMYEATMHYNIIKEQFNLKESEISRINKYGDQDWCIHDSLPNLRKYCYCIKPKPGN